MTFAVAANEKGEKVLTMLKEYIEREALKEDLKESYDRLKAIYDGLTYDEDKQICAGQLTTFTEAILRVKEAPAADVAPVVHGRWKFGRDLPDSFGSIIKNKYHLYCSECHNQAFNKTVDNDPDFDVDTPFCPWCGAKMDG